MYDSMLQFVIILNFLKLFCAKLNAKFMLTKLRCPSWLPLRRESKLMHKICEKSRIMHTFLSKTSWEIIIFLEPPNKFGSLRFSRFSYRAICHIISAQHVFFFQALLDAIRLFTSNSTYHVVTLFIKKLFNIIRKTFLRRFQCYQTIP